MKTNTPRRVDHAATAIATANQAGSLVQTHDDAGGAAKAAIAQVHATLALVEQQRIANIIALSQVRIAPGDIPIFRHLTVQPVGLSGVDIRPEIKEGLGL